MSRMRVQNQTINRVSFAVENSTGNSVKDQISLITMLSKHITAQMLIKLRVYWTTLTVSCKILTFISIRNIMSSMFIVFELNVFSNIAKTW